MKTWNKLILQLNYDDEALTNVSISANDICAIEELQNITRSEVLEMLLSALEQNLNEPSEF